MTGDPEIEAMSAVAIALADLEENAQGRVLRWAAERYGVTMPMGSRRSRGAADGGAGNDNHEDLNYVAEQETAEEEVPSYEHFAEFFAAASPKTDEDKALVAAYWVQVHEGHDQWQSRRLNTELKHLGHAISNITYALTRAMQKKPQRVIQLKKSGGAAQATKTYKVTNEGIVYVRAMLSGGSA